MDPGSLVSDRPFPDFWPFSHPEDPSRTQGAGFPVRDLGVVDGGSRDGSAEESSVTEQSGGSRGRSARRGRDFSGGLSAVEGEEDESSKAFSTSCGLSSGNDLTDCDIKRMKIVGPGSENGNPKPEIEESSGLCNKDDQNAQPSDLPKQDYIHVRARRGQATDKHSLAERARREKISERMKILQDLVPGCNKIIGKASVLDEIINYIQSLQRQVEFLSMKLEAINSSRISTNIEGFPAKEFGFQASDSASSLAFGTHPARDFSHGPSSSDWLHMQVGGCERTM